MFRSFFALLASTCCISAWAAESLNTKIHNQYNSLRALGMGNAFTAVADDYSLLFYNPAGLARKKTGEIQFSLVGAGVSDKTTKIVKDIDDASKSGTTESEKAQAISDALEPYYGAPLGARVQAIEFFWVRPNWGIALLPLDLTIDIGVHRQLGPALDLNIKKDTTIAYGYGGYLTNTLAAGITAKFIHRDSVEQAVSALELASDSNILSTNRFKEGTNIDFDLGFMWSPRWFSKDPVIEKEKDDDDAADDADEATPSAKVGKAKVKNQRSIASEEQPAEEKIEDLELTDQEEKPAEPPPKPIKKKAHAKAKKKEKSSSENLAIHDPLTFSLVVRNVISENFSKSTAINKDAVEAPAKNPRVVDVGANYEFAKWGGLTLRTTLDFRNLMHPNTTFKKSTHAGLEIDYSPNGWFKTQLRGGLNQMYYTAGATFLFGILEIDAVTYGEEVGTTTTSIENRVYAAKVGFNF